MNSYEPKEIQVNPKENQFNPKEIKLSQIHKVNPIEWLIFVFQNTQILSSFQTKVVKYDKVQQEKCQPRYKYNCWIEMKDVTMTMDSRICNKVPTRDCDRTDGKIVCQTAYESGETPFYLVLFIFRYI